MKKVVIYPDKRSNSNFYLEHLTTILKERYEVRGFSEVKREGGRTLFSGDVYHFNWYESFDSKWLLVAWARMLMRKHFLRVLKKKKKKIVWTVHNSMPHDTRHPKVARSMLTCLAKYSDRIHILCEKTRELDYLGGVSEKIVYIPHGDYFGDFPKCELDVYAKYKIEKEKKIILFVGQIRKYKNIEILMDAFNDSRLQERGYVLLICGECKDNEYKQTLRGRYNSADIVFDFNFIKNEHMQAYLRSCSFVVAPYDKDSALNSGTLWMSMSYGRTMMLPKIGCVEDFEYGKYLYVYDYDDPRAHAKELCNCLRAVGHNGDDDEKGRLCLGYMKTVSWKKNKQKWVGLFDFDD